MSNKRDNIVTHPLSSNAQEILEKHIRFSLSLHVLENKRLFLVKEFKEKKMQLVYRHNRLSSKIKNGRLDRIYKNLLLLGDYKYTWLRLFKNALNKLLLIEMGKDIHKIDHTRVYFYESQVFIESSECTLSEQLGVWSSEDNVKVNRFINELREKLFEMYKEIEVLQMFDRVPCQVFLADLDSLIEFGTYPF